MARPNKQMHAKQSKMNAKNEVISNSPMTPKKINQIQEFTDWKRNFSWLV